MDIQSVVSFPGRSGGAINKPAPSTETVVAGGAVAEVKTADAAKTVQQPSPDREALDKAVSDLETFTQSIQRNLSFAVDEESGTMVMKVTDRATGELIRQLPSEEALRLAERLDEMRSLLFKSEA